VLNSPVPDVIFDVARKRLDGQVVFLDIELHPRGPLRMAIATFEGRRAGAITADALVRLLECMESGFRYHARVENVAGARVEVQVELK
jgi:hypothetical protein